ncbi:hypothetical protein BRYFOR_06901 [Marvinbryantia formatexigens DSM 14469]|uniref:Uncharacterized protein n=1 Tax=Marvinbryantia formatexigens DSM 14469 TaxID=478749 RepID=C6LE52_9FIRM|nr:hypothetical protein BRYFOR_06901 [Marvinbryantia formatexigens DSM 14469]
MSIFPCAKNHIFCTFHDTRKPCASKKESFCGSLLTADNFP